jgi:methionyl-tRNA formyltransferase
MIRSGGVEERIKFLRVEVTDAGGPPGTLIAPNFVIACGSGAIRAIDVQRAGKPPAKAEEVWRGMQLRLGERFLSTV